MKMNQKAQLLKRLIREEVSRVIEKNRNEARHERLIGLIREEVRKVLNEGDELKTPDQLKTQNTGEQVVLRINSQEAGAPELKRLNGKFCTIESSTGSGNNYWATSIRLCDQSGNEFVMEPKPIQLPNGDSSGANGCDFSHFELEALVKITSNPTSRRIRRDGEIIDNPDYNPNGKIISSIVKKY